MFQNVMIEGGVGYSCKVPGIAPGYVLKCDVMIEGGVGFYSRKVPVIASFATKVSLISSTRGNEFTALITG